MIVERKCAELALHEAKNELELKALERTADPRKASEDLVVEIDQRNQVDEAPS